MNRRIALLALLAAAPPLLRAAENPAASDAPRARAGPYEVTLMLPPAGLFAGEEMELEFRVLDFRADGAAAAGPVPVLFARFQCEVDMPSMPGMARFHEVAHREDVAGVYGAHELGGMRGHGYFFANTRVSSDVLVSMVYPFAPARRGLAHPPGRGMWTFPDDYPRRVGDAVYAAAPGLRRAP